MRIDSADVKAKLEGLAGALGGVLRPLDEYHWSGTIDVDGLTLNVTFRTYGKAAGRMTVSPGAYNARGWFHAMGEPIGLDGNRDAVALAVDIRRRIDFADIRARIAAYQSEQDEAAQKRAAFAQEWSDLQKAVPGLTGAMAGDGETVAWWITTPNAESRVWGHMNIDGQINIERGWIGKEIDPAEALLGLSKAMGAV